MDILKRQQFGSALTTYDLLKALAIILMIVDHIGAFFFPDEVYLRVIGRLCLPIWFFLIGFSPSRHIPKEWIIGALVLIGVAALFQERLFTLNILVTMILLRLTLDHLAPFFLQSRLNFALWSVLCGLLAMPTTIYVEYGTLAIPLAMFGLAMRRGIGTHEHALIVLLTFVATQTVMFDFAPQVACVFLGLATLPVWLCYAFRPGIARLNLPVFLETAVQFMGRRTLEIYVIHLALLQALSFLFFSP